MVGAAFGSHFFLESEYRTKIYFQIYSNKKKKLVYFYLKFLTKINKPSSLAYGEML